MAKLNYLRTTEIFYLSDKKQHIFILSEINDGIEKSKTMNIQLMNMTNSFESRKA